MIKKFLRPLWRATIKKVLLGIRLWHYKWLRSALKGGTVIMDMPQIGGKFHISLQSDLLMRQLIEQQYEPNEVSLLQKMAKNMDGDFVDVGANVGIFSVAIGRIFLEKSHKVCAIEAHPFTFTLLLKNIDLNLPEKLLSKMIMLNIGASDKNETIPFYTIDGKAEYGSFLPIDHPAVSTFQTIVQQLDVTPLDSIAQKHQLRPSLIKMDTEGLEFKVLNGMQNILKEFSPIVLLEVNKTEEERRIYQYLIKSNYTLLAFEPRKNLFSPGNRIACLLDKSTHLCKEYALYPLPQS